MKNARIEFGYFDDEGLRKSFNTLAKDTFGLDFESWYKEKAYYGRYTPYSYVTDNQVIANISANRFYLMVDGVPKTAIQLGTVMTHPDFRKQGLSRLLMEHVLNQYVEKKDIIFLFANQSVLDFYPKFGFKRYDETIFEIDASKIEANPWAIHLLDPNSRQDAFTLTNTAKMRKPISKTLGVYNDKWPLYCYMKQPSWERYYLVDEGAVVLGKREDDVLNIYDIISRGEVHLDNILEKIVSKEDKKIKLHFSAKSDKYKLKKINVHDDDNALFVLSKEPLKGDISFPLTSHT